MKLLLLFGDAAVGKMTVGQEIVKRTSFKLFHNHMTIEPVIELFGFYHAPTVNRMRRVVFEEYSQTDAYGLIFTFMWAFDHEEDWRYVEEVVKIFEQVNAEVYYVELHAPLEVRLERNKTENRLQHKASKRDLATSEARVKREYEKYRCTSLPGEITFPNYLKIDNTNRTPEDVAQEIIQTFEFK